MTPSAERTLQSASAKRTRALGVALGRLLQPGDFIGLVGELGAGKTELARGIAEGAGVDPAGVASPSFAIVYPYRGRLTLYHADLYRLAGEEELYATGYFDLLNAGDGALLVEWVDHVPSAAPEQRVIVRIEVAGAHRRRLLAQAAGPRAVQLVDAWAQAAGGSRGR